MVLTYRPIKVQPAHWRAAGDGRGWSPFRSSYRTTLEQLDRELWHLGATDVILQVDVDQVDLRLDGQLRANTVPQHPGVILTIETTERGTLVFDTDRWRDWQGNLRGIALGLEALRKIERYGIADAGQQFAGYAELPATAMGGLTLEGAAELLLSMAGEPDEYPAATVLADLKLAESLYRAAAYKHHPDRGGDVAIMAALTEAIDLVRKAAKGPL